MSITFNPLAILKPSMQIATTGFILIVSFLITHSSQACEGVDHAPITSSLDKTAKSDFFAHAKPGSLTADQAFRLKTTPTISGLTFIWHISKDYYLYKHRFAIIDANGQNITDQAIFMPGIAKHDEHFGDVEVYYFQAIIELPFNALNCGSLKSCNNHGPLTVKYQGCAETGVCYEPQAQQINIHAL